MAKAAAKTAAKAALAAPLPGDHPGRRLAKRQRRCCAPPQQGGEAEPEKQPAAKCAGAPIPCHAPVVARLIPFL